MHFGMCRAAHSHLDPPHQRGGEGEMFLKVQLVYQKLCESLDSGVSISLSVLETIEVRLDCSWVARNLLGIFSDQHFNLLCSVS